MEGLLQYGINNGLAVLLLILGGIFIWRVGLPWVERQRQDFSAALDKQEVRHSEQVGSILESSKAQVDQVVNQAKELIALLKNDGGMK